VGGLILFVTANALIACLHDQNKCGFLEGQLLSSQSEPFEKFSKSSDWLDKSQSSKKGISHFCFDHINRLLLTKQFHIN